jgi:unsaturated rhamnogalacturonyl hydrolase
VSTNDEAGLRDVLRNIATRTLDFDLSVWYWGDAIMIDGLLDAGELLDDEVLTAAARTHIERWVRRVEVQGFSWADHLTPGSAAIRMAQRYGDHAMLDAVERLAVFLNNAPRSRWLGAPLRRPDLYADRNLVVVDSLYNEAPLFFHLGAATGNDIYFDWGRDAVEPMLAALIDSSGTGLFRQAVDTATRKPSGAGWARGNGWALLGIVDALGFFSRSRPEHDRLASLVRTVADRLLSLQDASGFWHTILDNREAYLETSTAAFFSATFDKAMRIGVIETAAFASASQRALAALLTRIDRNGDVFGVSADSFPDEDARSYLRLPTGVNEWGQGSALRAIAERLRLQDSRPPQLGRPNTEARSSG